MMAERKASGFENLTANEKGRRFEEQVARWLKGQLSKYNPTVKTNQFANGYTVKHPYQIDVHARFKTGGVFSQPNDVWIECKWKQASSVKRNEIMKLVSSAQDVFYAAREGRNEIYFNGLMLVSNQWFDSDAISYADQHDVSCITYDGKRYEPQNNSETWLSEPAWLAQVK